MVDGVAPAVTVEPADTEVELDTLTVKEAGAEALADRDKEAGNEVAPVAETAAVEAAEAPAVTDAATDGAKLNKDEVEGEMPATMDAVAER